MECRAFLYRIGAYRWMKSPCINFNGRFPLRHCRRCSLVFCGGYQQFIYFLSRCLISVLQRAKRLKENLLS